MNYSGFPATYNPYLPQYNQYLQWLPQPQQLNAPFPQGQGNTTPQPQADDRIFVNGEQEALAWVVLRGQNVRLWDRNGRTFYVKAVSETGQPLPLEIYDYSKRVGDEQPQKQAPPPPQQEKPIQYEQLAFDPADYVKHEEFDEFKKQISESSEGVKNNAQEQS